MSGSIRGIQSFGGNMPFLGGRRIASVYGERYTDWLTEIHGGTGDTDYVGYFFHRAAELMTPSGTMGFIATNSIAEGDNRRTVLARMVERKSPALPEHGRLELVGCFLRTLLREGSLARRSRFRYADHADAMGQK